MDKKTEILKEMINESNSIVFFGGAGVSTESGIKDFRSVDGLYNQKYEYPPETILSHSFFIHNTEAFYKFYRDKLNCLDAKPNITHEVLAELENKEKLKSIITQNIDGLHQEAGNKNVFELHGSIHRNYCMKCHKFYGPEKVFNTNEPIPLCDECGGIVKTDVVLYEEGLDEKILSSAIKSIEKSDLLIVGGTSLMVYPAAGLIRYFKGNKLVLINKQETAFDNFANLVIHDSIGKTFKNIKQE